MRAVRARGVDAVVVATDDERIAQAVRKFGGIARLTDPNHRTGTDRIAEAARDLSCDIVVNVQGDEPLIEPDMITQVIEPLADDRVRMTTARTAITDLADHENPNVVKVVVDARGDALYFSRAPIPHVRDGRADPAAGGGAAPPGRPFKHIGIYGYRRNFLLEFAALPRTPLEIAESLEQLRALEHGIRIRTLDTPYDSIGVDTPEDLERVRTALGGVTAAARA